MEFIYKSGKMVDVGCNVGCTPIPIYKHIPITFGGPDGSPDFGASLFASWIVGLLPHPPLFKEILQAWELNMI